MSFISTGKYKCSVWRFSLVNTSVLKKKKKTPFKAVKVFKMVVRERVTPPQQEVGRQLLNVILAKCREAVVKKSLLSDAEFIVFRGICLFRKPTGNVVF